MDARSCLSPLGDGSQDQLPGVLEVLLSRGVPKSILKTACRAAVTEGISPPEYLVRHAFVSMECLYSAFAEYCGVPFMPEKGFRFRTFNDKPLAIGEQECGPILLSLYRDKTLYAIAPEISQFEDVYVHLRKYPEFAKQIRISSPDGLDHASSVMNSPSGDLESRYPLFSASKIRFSATAIGLSLVFLTAPLILGWGFVPFVYAVMILGLGACTISGCARLFSALSFQKADTFYKLPELLRSGPVRWPEYTVLVPLYREARMLDDLVTSLMRLNYPIEKLQILLLIEEDDEETLHAIPKRLPDHIEVMVVPDGTPRTKPRALSYGLASATGQYVTVFDAEDRPDPDQLKTAAFFFTRLRAEFACLQARLAIDNANESFVSRQFALEYACLFDQLLPWFFRNSWPFPLGGTSNHFQISALEAVGGWDKYNVTEDADLGVRLERLGYRVGMLPSQTLEEAPVTIGAWVAQRARWHKGWLQTILVHSREPERLVADLGLKRTLVLASLFLGTFFLIALHPIFAGVIVSYALGLQQSPFFILDTPVIAVICVVAGSIGYLGTLAALWIGAGQRGYGVRLADCISVPFYWLLAGIAFYRAVWELFLRPYHWNKTEHGVSKKRRSFGVIKKLYREE
ncbi:MAG: glycosyltransferase family 2 protein [Roseibium sp.]